jgi:hypothetical protein
MTASELQTAIDKTPAPKVTAEYMKSRIKGQTFFRPTGTLTVCVIELDSGFTVTGESACASPENYRQDIGEKIAYDNAFEKLWPLFGFALKEELYAGAKAPQPLPLSVDKMVNAFLSWSLPEDFRPDGGISFDPIANRDSEHEHRRAPVGTNLLDAAQAREMVCHLLDAAGVPAF